ncbi:hypothetical protein [Hyalangium versicolor]|uniref:hypothetical protein n=1 Tax=Hyalangium versicolor TaxID=2861190 RepID=UPI001CCA5601|nr:hypothetical protein [Hyalangium versicolor]
MRSLLALHETWKASLVGLLVLLAMPARAADVRIGLGLDLSTESSRMAGHQTINGARQDESFDYKSHDLLTGTLYLTIPAPVSEHARMGAGIRVYGNYGVGGDRVFSFGTLSEGFVSGEYGLPIANRMEAMFGARGGLALLLPGKEFQAEIDRLQDQGVSAWSVPRVGWLAAISVGARRKMSDHILLRGDVSGQLERLFLFATNQDIKGNAFNKTWNTLGLRIGLTLGIEFAL